jgi:tetratricopeptide (TPR) repeat protein
MRASVLLVMLLAGAAVAEPVRAPTCDVAGARVAQIVAGDGKLVAQRCERDRWTADARTCFTLAATEQTQERCLDTLTKDQRNQLAGDVDRLAATPARRKLERWLARRPLALAPLPAPRTQLVLAIQSDAPDVSKARALRAEGMSAYRAGRFDIAIRKLSAANDVDPAPELLYNLAQSYRFKGDRGNALDLYAKYLELAPHGAAAADCRHQIELLDDEP